MTSVVELAKALADPNRVRALLALKEGELCVCQVVELLKLAPSTVSRHMAVLRQAGLVESRKKGRWVYYRITRGEREIEVDQAISWLSRCCGDSEEERNVRHELERICSLDPRLLSRRQQS